MVVMELLDETWITLDKASGPRSGLKADISRTLSDLHEAKMVHGDIRDINIMVKKDKADGPEQFKILGFNWAGIAGEVKYPFFLKQDTAIGRPEGVGFNAIIRPEHDMAMLNNIHI